jgi:benzoyl-CoA reductase/2-hydroxyglutaryl-CoA dehydratase subunit BcrC/BadD/HgdB
MSEPCGMTKDGGHRACPPAGSAACGSAGAAAGPSASFSPEPTATAFSPEPTATASAAPQSPSAADDPAAHFGRMIANCLQYAQAAHAAGKPVVGILCEFTPRELIMAVGAVPVCLCGGSAKTIPAAEEQLPANLCPLIKSTFGYHVQKSNPFLEMADLVVAETTCDGKKKMYELLSDSRPVMVLELPQKVDECDALEHWLRELEKFRRFLEQRYSTTATDARLREAIAIMNRERALRRELAALMQSDAPPLSGRQLLDFKSSISAIPADLEQYERAIALYRKRCQGPFPGKRRPPGEDPRPEKVPDTLSRVRVLMTGVPMVHGAERVLEIIEGAGGLVVAMEDCTGLKPILEDVDETAADPLQALAEKYLHLPCSVMTRNDRRIESLRRLTGQYRPECVVELIWQACLTYDVESHRIRRLAEEELRLPYLRIETDYSPSDSARIGVRVEALLETVRGAKVRPKPP